MLGELNETLILRGVGGTARVGEGEESRES